MMHVGDQHHPWLSLILVPGQFLTIYNQGRWLLPYESESEVARSCPTLCDPMDCSPPGSSVYGILQARTLEWVAISFSRGSSQLRDGTQASCITGRCFNLWATREALPYGDNQISSNRFSVSSPRQHGQEQHFYVVWPFIQYGLKGYSTQW